MYIHLSTSLKFRGAGMLLAPADHTYPRDGAAAPGPPVMQGPREIFAGEKCLGETVVHSRSDHCGRHMAGEVCGRAGKKASKCGTQLKI